ncbi:MAG: hypothetical protein ACRDBM_15195, partial [Sporomusa sp.]
RRRENMSESLSSERSDKQRTMLSRANRRRENMSESLSSERSEEHPYKTNTRRDSRVAKGSRL